MHEKAAKANCGARSVRSGREVQGPQRGQRGERCGLGTCRRILWVSCALTLGLELRSLLGWALASQGVRRVRGEGGGFEAVALARDEECLELARESQSVSPRLNQEGELSVATGRSCTGDPQRSPLLPFTAAPHSPSDPLAVCGGEKASASSQTPLIDFTQTHLTSSSNTPTLYRQLQKLVDWPLFPLDPPRHTDPEELRATTQAAPAWPPVRNPPFSLSV